MEKKKFIRKGFEVEFENLKEFEDFLINYQEQADKEVEELENLHELLQKAEEDRNLEKENEKLNKLRDSLTDDMCQSCGEFFELMKDYMKLKEEANRGGYDIVITFGTTK